MSDSDQALGSSDKAPKEAVARAFGAGNRARLLARYFETAGPVTPANAWQHVYRLLLWIDRTTALAHCYESDKAQPGRSWYARSLAFHDWLSQEFDLVPAKLADEIDWLFRQAVKDLATRLITGRSESYERQREPYAGRSFPEPGEDPELAAIIRETLRGWLNPEPPAEVIASLTRRIHTHLSQENKRKNLVGEGFEDVIAAILFRLNFNIPLEVKTRIALHDLPGFHQPAPNEKIKKVDLGLIQEKYRTLATAKWSIRADREEQFMSDFQTYERLEAVGQDFAYVLITNEFDAARLRAACERRRQNAPLFTHVVHLNPAAVNVVYREAQSEGSAAVRAHIENGRLISFQKWLSILQGASSDS
ncbi:MAG: hypothetical protein H0X40_14770 [Chthoniobacterales bacterium]|nr:hypothetical protein [Chthoniobacterales bacterium]